MRRVLLTTFEQKHGIYYAVCVCQVGSSNQRASGVPCNRSMLLSQSQHTPTPTSYMHTVSAMKFGRYSYFVFGKKINHHRVEWDEPADWKISPSSLALFPSYVFFVWTQQHTPFPKKHKFQWTIKKDEEMIWWEWWSVYFDLPRKLLTCAAVFLTQQQHVFRIILNRKELGNASCLLYGKDQK